LINRAVYLFFIPILIFIIVANKEFVSVLFGTKYLSATWLMVGVLFFLTLNAFQYPLGLAIFAIEKNQINFFSRIFSLYNFVMDIILVRYWGITGVMLATGTAVTLKNLFIHYYANKQVKLTWDWGAYLKILVNALVMGAAVWLLRGVIVNVWTLVVVIVFGFVIFLLMTLINNCFTHDEMAILKRAAHQFRIPFLSKIIK
jgi:O-antigen/teichoic acid export membrane protein